ncbi:glycosyltransferase family 87 protein [Granulicella arctica]|uniref:glycosyltransferase family 87 protein n=1 Tax=Granulicella arctica TaxID=940613 RepID=UPI0021DF6B48|nr:glycosyltransferase family 87 protein [Granulicella arctica]
MASAVTNPVMSRWGSDISPRIFLIGLMLLASCLYGSLVRDSYCRDFRAYYVAAMATHDHLDPYVNQINVSEKYSDALWMNQVSRFVYPPTALPFFYAFGWASYNHAKALFGILILATMIGILDFFHRRHPGQTVVLFALFMSVPMFTNIDLGQVDVFILALVVGAFYLGDGWKSGLCLGVAISIKLAPVLLVLWLLGNKRWRTVLWSGVAAAGLALVALAWWGTGLYREYFHHMLDAETGHHSGFLTHRYESLKILAGRLIVTQDVVYEFQHALAGFRQNPLFVLGPKSVFIGLAVPLVFLAWMLWSQTGRRLSEAQSFFLFVVACLFANLSLWPMGLVACFPLVILLVASSRTPQRTALLLLAPLFLTKQLVGDRNFLIWMVLAGFCVVQNGWFRAKSEVADGPLVEAI